MKVIENSYILVSGHESHEKVIVTYWLVVIKVIKKSYILVSGNERHKKSLVSGHGFHEKVILYLC